MSRFPPSRNQPPPRPVAPVERAENPRAVVGNNAPPVEPAPEPVAASVDPLDTIATANVVFAGVNTWMNDHPVVETADEAAQGARFYDAATTAFKAMEADRDNQVRPLNEKVRTINEAFRTPKDKLEKLYKLLLQRLKVFKDAEDAKRAAIAEEKRLAAQALIDEALAAEAREKEAIENASLGEVDADVGGATAEAEEKVSAAKVAMRDAARAERDVNSKIRGSGKALSFRDAPEVLTVIDAVKAVAAIVALRDGEVPEKLAAVLETEARAYRKAKGRLPDGVTSSKGAQ